DLAVQVAAQQVHRVVAADRHAVAVAGHQPDVELGIGELDAGGEGRGAAMDRVEAVALHIVRKPARAADARDEHGLGGVRADLGQGALHRLENRIVAAAGAPADFLVGLPVLESRLDGGHVVHGFTALMLGSWTSSASTSPPSLPGMLSKKAAIASWISPIVNGCPLVLLSDLASTRY